MIIFSTAIYLAILTTEARQLYKTKKKEFWVYFSILSLAYLMLISNELGINLPKPIDYIERLVSIFIKE